MLSAAADLTRGTLPCMSGYCEAGKKRRDGRSCPRTCPRSCAPTRASDRRACTAAAEARPAEAANSASDRGEPRAGRAVRVQLTVHGGMDLRLTTPSANARHRRVPSHEALSQMAAQHRTPVPPPKPAGITPAPRSVIEVPQANATMRRLATLIG